MITKERCVQGKILQDELDAKIALAEGLLRGRYASGYFNCKECGGWHLGKPKVSKTCWATGKVRFLTEEDADQEVRKLQSRGREETNHYLCDHCNTYHLTSLKKGEYHR